MNASDQDVEAETKVSVDEDLGFVADAKRPAPNIFVEFGDFLFHNKKWWLTPIIVILLAMSLFIALTNTAIGPFIYVLF